VKQTILLVAACTLLISTLYTLIVIIDKVENPARECYCNNVCPQTRESPSTADTWTPGGMDSNNPSDTSISDTIRIYLHNFHTL